jgi:hypothetical protein
VVKSLVTKLDRVKAGVAAQQYVGTAGEEKLSKLRGVLDTAVRGMDSLLALRNAELQGRRVQLTAQRHPEEAHGHAFAGLKYDEFQSRRLEQEKQQRRKQRKISLAIEQELEKAGDGVPGTGLPRSVRLEPARRAVVFARSERFGKEKKQGPLSASLEPKLDLVRPRVEAGVVMSVPKPHTARNKENRTKISPGPGAYHEKADYTQKGVPGHQGGAFAPVQFSYNIIVMLYKTTPITH